MGNNLYGENKFLFLFLNIYIFFWDGREVYFFNLIIRDEEGIWRDRKLRVVD